MLLCVLTSITLYVGLSMWVAPRINALYANNPDVFFAPSHFNDARQYVYICSQGYSFPWYTLPTLERSRINWMPVYAVIQCGLHRLLGVSLVYAGWVASTLAIGIGLLITALTLVNLGIQQPWLHAFAILTPLIGGVWLYLPGVEATYLMIGMIVMWLITLPPARHPVVDLVKTLAALVLGFTFMMTKPNALAFLLPLLFAFLYQSWQRSRLGGYEFGLWTFPADVVIEHSKPLIVGFGRLLRRRVELETRPIEYEWSPLAVGTGVMIGFTYWLAYTSRLTGVPFYFLQQQTTVWGRAWPSGNIAQMALYFRQAFNPIGSGGSIAGWRLSAAWNLAANLSALIPAASRRVPGLIRGMLPLAVLFLLYSGAVHGSDRYILSTALVAVGWACWLAPKGKPTVWWPLRWLFVIGLFVITSLLLVNQMMPIGEPNAWGITDR